MTNYLMTIHRIDDETGECCMVYSALTNTNPMELNTNGSSHPAGGANQQTGTRPIVEQLKDAVTVSDRKLAKSTVSNRMDAIKVLERFICEKHGDGKDITLSDLTPDMLLELEEHYIAARDYRDTAANGCACHMRNLKAMVGAIAGKRRASELFRLVRTRPQPTVGRALTEEELTRFATMPLPQRLEATRTTGLAQFLCMGMAFCDFIRQRKGQLAGNYICYRRKKTGAPIRVPISQEIRDLFARLRDDGGDKSDFLLPYLAGSTPGTEERMAGSALRKYNRDLNEIGRLMGLDMSLTSYCFRHTFATLAVENGIEDSLVSRIFGHSRKEVTAIYTKRGTQRKIDEASWKMHAILFPGHQAKNMASQGDNRPRFANGC